MVFEPERRRGIRVQTLDRNEECVGARAGARDASGARGIETLKLAPWNRLRSVEDVVVLWTGQLCEARLRLVDAERRQDARVRAVLERVANHQTEVIRDRRRGLGEVRRARKRGPRCGARRRRLRGERHLVDAVVVRLRGGIQGDRGSVREREGGTNPTARVFCVFGDEMPSCQTAGAWLSTRLLLSMTAFACASERTLPCASTSNTVGLNTSAAVGASVRSVRPLTFAPVDDRGRPRGRSNASGQRQAGLSRRVGAGQRDRQRSRSSRRCREPASPRR